MPSLKELKSKGIVLEPIIIVGKGGLTDSVVKEIKNQLKKRKLIKIKFLKGIVKEKGKKELAAELIAKTNAKLVQHVGFVVVLYKK